MLPQTNVRANYYITFNFQIIFLTQAAQKSARARRSTVTRVFPPFNVFPAVQRIYVISVEFNISF